MFWFLLIAALVCGFIGYRYWTKRIKRAELLASAMTDNERDVILNNVPMLRKLPQPLGEKLEGKIRLFLDQVEFIGCDELEVTDEMRLTIAAQACVIVLNRNTWYDHLRTILIYPGAFKSKQIISDGLIETERETVRLGESWQRGPVVLSWQHSEHGAFDDNDGHNVVLHEFAHQLDALTGDTNAVPDLNVGQTFAEWEKVFMAAYEKHVMKTQAGAKTVIDPYGAESYVEFFAVAIEVFFEKPEALNAEAPAVYEQLSQLLALDPLRW